MLNDFSVHKKIDLPLPIIYNFSVIQPMHAALWIPMHPLKIHCYLCLWYPAWCFVPWWHPASPPASYLPLFSKHKGWCYLDRWTYPSVVLWRHRTSPGKHTGCMSWMRLHLVKPLTMHEEKFCKFPKSHYPPANHAIHL